MADEAKDQTQKKRSRKKAIGLAAAAVAAVATPAAAEVIVQKAEAPEIKTLPAPTAIPEPARFEYSKPRPLRTIGDLLKGVLGVGGATAEENSPPSTMRNINEHNEEIRDWSK